MQQQRPSALTGDASASLADLQRTLVYKTTSSPASIRDDLARVKALDKDAEAKQRIWTGVAIVSLIIGVFCTFALFATGGIREQPIFLFGILPLFAIAAVGFVMMVKYGRLNLDDRRYSLVSQLLRYLATDMGRAGLLDLRIDFNSYQQRRYQTSRAGGATSYAVPWLALKGTFADGSRFRLSVTQVVKRKERRKRKYTKVKVAAREKVRLTVLASTKRYTGLERMERLLRGAQQPPGMQLCKVGASANRIDILAMTDCHRKVFGRNASERRGSVPSTMDHHSLLGLFLACYHCLGQCRIRKKGA